MLTLNNSKYHFSYYENLYSTKAPQRELDINELIEIIKYRYIKDTITLLRTTNNKEAYNKIKASSIPAVTLSGTFKERKTKGFQEHSGLMQIDIDHVVNYNTVFKQLIEDEYTYVAFKSPGGNGIKLVVKINPNEPTHKEQFYALEQYYKDKYNIEIDPACKDIARCMLLSYDPNTYCNPYSKVYEECKKLVQEKPKKEHHDISHLNLVETEKDSIIEQIVKQTERYNIDITEGYENWFKIGCAISTTLGESGRDYFHRLSRLNPDYNQENCDRQYNNLNANNNGSISLGTLVYYAKEHNIEVHFPKEANSKTMEKPIICYPKRDNKKRFLLGQKGKEEFLAIALNPSTANEETLDPTSRNIQTIALNNNCDGWYMVNLYAGRTSKPELLPKTPNNRLIEDNLSFIRNLLNSKDYNISKVLLCWGNGVDSFNYLKESAKSILTILKDNNLPCYYMKMTGRNNPFHPAPTPVNRWLGGINKVILKPYKFE